jgi:arginine/ornithine N-succinyltransferase beta subunit
MSKSFNPTYEPQEAPRPVLTDIRELAKKHGQQLNVHDGDPYKLAHQMAALLHGWPSEQYHQGVVEMSEADYLKALEASETGQVHAPANRRPS